MHFEQFWSQSVEFLNERIRGARENGAELFVIPNWSADGRVRFPVVPIYSASRREIVCGLVGNGNREVNVPKSLLKTFYEKCWTAYKTGELNRGELRDRPDTQRKTTYLISLMKFLESYAG